MFDPSTFTDAERRVYSLLLAARQAEGDERDVAVDRMWTEARDLGVPMEFVWHLEEVFNNIAGIYAAPKN